MNPKTLNIGKLVLTLALLNISGCFSSDSSEPEPVTVTPPAAGKLTVSGAIVGTNAAGADVTITVGSDIYSSITSTDSSGSFQVEIDQGSDSDLVIIDANVAASGLHLVAVAGSYGDLAASAVNGEAGGNDLSAITTAAYVLATSVTTDGSIDDINEYDISLDTISAFELVRIAGVMTLIDAAVNSVSLPSGYADTLQLVNDVVDGSATFLNDLETLYPGILETATDLIYANTDLASAFAPGSDAGVYLSDDSFTLYSLFENGTGFATFFDDDIARTVDNWAVSSDGDLVLDYSSELARSDRIRLLNTSMATMHTLQERINLPGTTGEVHPATFTYFAFDSAFDATQVAGTYALSDTDSSALVLNADGTGERLDEAGLTSHTVAWLVAGDGRLVLNQSDGHTVVLTRLSQDDATVAVLQTSILPGGVIDNMQVLPFDSM